MSNTDFGLYYTDDAQNFQEVENLELFIRPFEEKFFKFYIMGTAIVPNSIITVAGRIDSLLSHSTLDLSIHNNIGAEYWKPNDILTVGDSVIYPVLLKIVNSGYTEINSEVVIDMTLQTSPQDHMDSLSYYGPLLGTTYKYLSRPPEVIPSRIISINLIPEGSDYDSYLAYSYGSSLIILDNGSGIPYIKNKEETV